MSKTSAQTATGTTSSAHARLPHSSDSIHLPVRLCATIGFMGTRRTSEDRADRQARDQRLLRRAPTDETWREPKQPHCWVRQGNMIVPGLALGWRRDKATQKWVARVIVVDTDHQPKMIEAEATDVRPVDLSR